MTFIFSSSGWAIPAFYEMCLREVNSSIQACAALWGTVHSLRGWALSWRSFPNLVVLWSVGKHLEKHQRRRWKHPHLEITSAELLLITAKVNWSDATALRWNWKAGETNSAPDLLLLSWEPVTAVCGLTDDQQAQQNFYVLDQTTAPRTMVIPPTKAFLYSLFPQSKLSLKILRVSPHFCLWLIASNSNVTKSMWRI